MAREQYTFNTGTPGTPVTTTGGPGDSTVTNVSAQFLYDANGTHGQGAKSPSSSVQNGTLTITRTASPVWSMRLYFKVPATITGGSCRLGYVNSSGVRVAHVAYHDVANAFRVYDSASSSSQKWSSSALTKDQWYCVCLTGNRNTGELRCAYYLLGSQTPVQDVTTSGCNLLATDADTMVIGKGTAAVTTELFWDEFAWDFATDAPIGPVVTPPTITVANSPHWQKVDARGSTAGDGSTLAFSMARNGGGGTVQETEEGLFWVQQEATAQTWTLTARQSGVDYTSPVTVEAIPPPSDTIYLPDLLVLQPDGVTLA